MDNLLIVLDPDNKKHLYEQIYDHIKKEIREGKLCYGERLPSARLLAQQLQISRSTVDLAYGQLVSEGYLEAKPCQGYFVSHVEELYHIIRENDDMQKKEQKEIQKQQTEDSFLCDFSPNTIDMSYFPFSTWKRIHRQVLLDEQENVLHKGDPKGDERLRWTIVHYLHASRGVDCSPEQIIIGAGNDYLLLLLQKLFGDVRTVAMENETYLRAYRIFCSNAYRICVTDMDEKGMCAASLEQTNADLAYVMPAHQFPTGAVMPVGRRLELLGWAKEKENRYLIEDDYDSEFRFTGKPVPTLFSIDAGGKVIYMNTFSKTLTPTIRISYMVLPPELVQPFQESLGFLSCTVSNFEQYTLARFISQGYFEKHLNRMRTYYRKKRDLLIRTLKNSALAGKSDIIEQSAGLHFLLRLHTILDDACLKDRFQEQGLYLTGLSEYYHEPRPDAAHTYLINYSSLESKKIPEAIERLCQAVLSNS